MTRMDGGVTAILKRVRAGDKSALDELIPLVYSELHRIAEGYLRHESSGHTLQATSLIHEAYLRMIQQAHPDYSDRVHFYGVAARIMRQILVDHARARLAAKRGGGQKITLQDTLDYARGGLETVIAVDQALGGLHQVDQRKAQLVEMRYFGGMTAEEIAECTGIARHTVRRELRLAQAWLHREVCG